MAENGKDIDTFQFKINGKWYDQEKTAPAARHNALRLMSSVFSYAGTQNIIEKSFNPKQILTLSGCEKESV